MSNVNKLQKILYDSNNVVFFGGVGLYTESDILILEVNLKFLVMLLKKYYQSIILKNKAKYFFEYYRNHLIFDDIKPNRARYKLVEGEKEEKVNVLLLKMLMVFIKKLEAIMF